MEDKENDNIAASVSKNFGGLVIQRGKKLSFLGIDIYLNDYGKLETCIK